MMLPELIRVFFAVNLNDEVKTAIGKKVNLLKAKSKSNLIHWIKPDHLHITLQFMPALRTADLPALIHHVENEIAKMKYQIEFQLGFLHLFPDARHPRVIALNLVPQTSLVELSEAIGRGIIATNYPIEARRFQGHLTLARIKQAKEVNLDFLSLANFSKIEKIKVKEVILYRSELQAGGSVYTPLSRISFTNLTNKQ